MIPCISVENMRQSDAYTIQNHVPSLELMHRAAYGVFLAHSWRSPVAVVTGSGNNGGDGFALACILKDKGFDCVVFTLSRKYSEDSAFYASKAEQLGIPIEDFASGCLIGFECVVDCLLGTGFRGAVRDNYRAAIEEINQTRNFVISVDINSGLNGDTGDCDIAVKSDLTVTIGYIKSGLVSENAGHYMQRLVCADIGIIRLQDEMWICSQEEWREGYIICPHWLDMEVIKAYS